MRIRHLIPAVLATGLLLSAVAPVRAQVLDDVWLQIKASGKGFVVDDGTGEAIKASAKSTVYMHLIYATPTDGGDGGPPGQNYDYEVWGETTPGVWEVFDGGSFFAFGTNEHLFISDVEFYYPVGEIDAFGGYQTAEFKNKLDDKGGLKKCSYKTLGAELIEGTVDGAGTGVGGYKATGKSIDPSKLPFKPLS